MYRKLKKSEVTPKDVKEIFEFLNVIGWWNYVTFNSMGECTEAYNWNERLKKALERTE